MAEITLTSENFEQEVTNATNTVLVDFWAPWCGPCRLVAPILEEIAKERTDIKVGKINIDEQPDLAARFGVMSIPTLIVFQGGEIKEKAVGARPKAAILSLLGN